LRSFAAVLLFGIQRLDRPGGHDYQRTATSPRASSARTAISRTTASCRWGGATPGRTSGSSSANHWKRHGSRPRATIRTDQDPPRRGTWASRTSAFPRSCTTRPSRRTTAAALPAGAGGRGNAAALLHHLDAGHDEDTVARMETDGGAGHAV